MLFRQDLTMKLWLSECLHSPSCLAFQLCFSYIYQFWGGHYFSPSAGDGIWSLVQSRLVRLLSCISSLPARFSVEAVEKRDGKLLVRLSTLQTQWSLFSNQNSSTGFRGTKNILLKMKPSAFVLFRSISAFAKSLCGSGLYSWPFLFVRGTDENPRQVLCHCTMSSADHSH